jgi:polyhydroxyalkanoate synthesis regulator phasin
MAFSFNWAGTNIAQINPNQSRQAYDDAKNIGQALAGYERYDANRKYRDLLDEYGRSSAENPKVAELRARLAQLERRQQEIKGIIGA